MQQTMQADMHKIWAKLTLTAT